MKLKIISTAKGFYYISKIRKIKNNPLWVGPFSSKKKAIEKAERENKKGG